VDQADVMLRTRQAADAVGATKLDRPEWVAPDQRSGDVCVTLTNGSVNAGAAVNSGRNPNNYGHIVRFRERGHLDDNTFEWDVFLFAADPAFPALGGTKVPAGQTLFATPDQRTLFINVQHPGESTPPRRGASVPSGLTVHAGEIIVGETAAYL
jgi:uncharacterized protein